MKKIVWVLIITVLLLAIVIGEQIFVDNTLNTLIEKIETVNTKIDLTENVEGEEITQSLQEIDDFWTEKENVLCLFINHNDLSKVGETIKRVKNYAQNNNKEETLIELDVLKFYAESYKHVMEINPQNLL